MSLSWHYYVVPLIIVVIVGVIFSLFWRRLAKNKRKDDSP